ncbi:MAG: fumarate hydratase [Armatimonadota bacterium]|nr:fumarate hydratase [Armatimonadota bacterium]MDR7428533.1 fumarate hydratase [Armatimonadota bacterium]MDR7579686.1 fumarate hydratase [Armatimonadota bacterium]
MLVDSLPYTEYPDNVAPRRLPVGEVREAVAALLRDSVTRLPPDYLEALREAEAREESPLGRRMLRMLLENAELAEREGVATCQDTGIPVFFVQVGQDVHLTDGSLAEALEEAVREAYRGFRKSVVRDPLLRENTGDNTPPVVHYEIVPGDRVRIAALVKGFGAEMTSALRMLPATAGETEVKRFVVEVVRRAGPNACPPVIVGVGLGSSFDGVALLAKKALLRPLGVPNPKPHLARLERELLEAINATGLGPQGLGGRFTALAVHVESSPTHIAALPVAVNLNCSAPRRAEVVL